MSDISQKTSKKQSQKDCFLFFKKNIFIFVGMAIAAAICMYGIIGIYGFSAYPDEFGYWSVAAAILGHDWSEITSLGPYYSYGYSIILAPILFLFRDPIITYRMAIVLNLLFQCASFWVMNLILKELFPRGKKTVVGITAVIAVLYPAWSFYTMTTMAEAVIYFGFVILAYAMLRFLKKPSALSGICVIVLTIYLYLVHMRCLGIVGATSLTVLIWLFSRGPHREKKSIKGWIILPIIVALFAITFILKDKVIALLYHGTSQDMLTWNDYSGLAYRFSKIISLQGIVYLLKDVCGKLLYLGLATCGIGYYGICVCAKRAAGALGNIKARKAVYIDYLWIYIFLATFFQFMVALIYLNGASAPDADRLDNFLHGRYIDFYLPILMGIGLCGGYEAKKPQILMTFTFPVYLILGIVAIRTIAENNVLMNKPHGFTMIGMSYLIDIPLTDTIGFVKREILFSAVLTLVVFGVVLLARKKGMEILLAIMIPLQVFLSLNACDHFIFPYQSYIYGDIVVGKWLTDIHQQYPDKEVVHLFGGGNPYIELVQFANRDLHIKAIKLAEDEDPSQYLRDDIILITQIDEEREDHIENKYEEKWAAGHLSLYYNP